MRYFLIGLAPAGVTVHIKGLPEGRYRVQAHATSLGSDNAPAFVVSGDTTRQQIRVVLQPCKP